MGIASRTAAITSGNLLEFKPCGLVVAAAVGAVIGQNLREIRLGLNRLNERPHSLGTRK